MMIMNKTYVNFNFIHFNCNYCGKDLIPDINLKQLAKQITLECKDLKDEQTLYCLVKGNMLKNGKEKNITNYCILTCSNNFKFNIKS